MHISEMSIRRPAMMTMVILVFIVLGIYTYGRIGVELFPSINVPYVTVVTAYPGASAEEIETQIIKPMEAGLSGISKVKNITSIATEGSGIVLIEFDMSADADRSRDEVQKKIDALKGSLPVDAKVPTVIKRDMNDTPVMMLALQSKRPLTETYQAAKDIVQNRLEKVPGVSDTSLVGGQEREVHVNVNPIKLDQYGLSLLQISNRLRTENLNQPVGLLQRPEAEYNLRMLGEFKSIDEIANLKIPITGGSSIRLKDVADVSLGYEELRALSRVNGISAIGVTVFKQSDASVVDVADQALIAVSEIQAKLPADMKLVVTNNTADFIRRSLDGTKRTILEGVVTTALALLLFLREWRSMLIVLLAIPSSLIATMALIYFAGFSFNMMSLMGLALCIGILVDDSIVVIENIHRHLKMGKGPKQAALDGREEIGMAAIAITLSDVVVFAPIALMGGMIGQFFRQFGLTIVFATLFSLFISFTLTPMAASRLFKKQASKPLKEKRSIFGFLWRYTDPLAKKAMGKYEWTLNWSLDHKKTVLLVALLAFVGSFVVLPLKLVGVEFMPKADQSMMNITLEMSKGTPFYKTDEALKKIEKFLQTVPEIKFAQTSLGSSGGNMGSSSGANIGRIGITLYPKAERSRSVWQIGQQIRVWTDKFTAGKVTVSESDSMGFGGSDIQIQIAGDDKDSLNKAAEMVRSAVASIKGTADVVNDSSIGQPEIQFQIDRNRAMEMGLGVSDIARTFRASVSGDTAGQFREGDNDDSIIVSLDGADKISTTELGYITVLNNMGQPIQLNQVAEIKQGSGPTQIRRVNRQRTVTITGGLKGITQNDFLTQTKQKINSLRLPLNTQVTFGGQAQAMGDTFGQLIQALILSIVLVYMVLVMLYESFSTPFIRMMSLPLGIVGALMALAISHTSLNLFSMIGIIMLDGLVAKNGTLLLDYTQTLQQRGYVLRDALIEAGKVRLRPIIMTTTTMIFGMLPSAMSAAEGSETRRGMAWVLIGGLITSTIFTLVVIPVVTVIMDKLKKKLFPRQVEEDEPELVPYQN